MANSVEGKTIQVHITYLDKDGPCVKVFAQPDKYEVYSTYIEKFLYHIRGKFMEHNLSPKNTKDIPVGKTCCAKFEDGTYYRAKVVSLDKLNSHHLVGVYFIDHGNSAEVKVDNIVILNRVMDLVDDDQKTGITYLLQTPPLVEEYWLQGYNAPQGQEWDEAAIASLRDKFCNIDAICKVYEFNGKKLLQFQAEINSKTNLNRDSSMRVGDVKHSQIPKLEQARLRPNLSVPPPSLSLQALPSNRLPNLSHPPPMVHAHSPLSLGGPSFKKPGVLAAAPGMAMKNVRPATFTLPTPLQNLQLATEMLVPGVSHLVFVSHVDDGPNAFSIQIQSVVTSVLMHMMKEINSLEPRRITAPLNPGAICLARYHKDESLCRAVVTSHVCDTKVKLYFADFGNSEVVPFSDIYEIPPEFVTPKVMSHRFTLANIKDTEYTDYEKKMFKDLVTNSHNLMLKVTPPEANPLKQYCELFLNCKNIKIILSEMAKEEPVLRFIPVPLPSKGSQEKVYVPFVINPGRFFVQLEKNSFTLEQVMSSVATHCDTAPHLLLSQLRVGHPCCAMYEDDTWYRAEIIKLLPENKALVNFVDYGNQDEIELANLRQATLQLITTVKAQAIVCCLKGYETKQEIDEKICNRFEELILEQSLTMVVVNVTGNNVLIVQLQDNQGQDIGTLLEARPISVTAAQLPASDGFEGNAPSNRPYAEKRFPDSQETRYNTKGKRSPLDQVTSRDSHHAPHKSHREDNRKSWRSRDDGEAAPRSGNWNENTRPDRRRDEEEKPWNRGETRFNREDNREEGRGGRFSRDEDGGGKFGGRDRFGGERGGGGGKFNDSSSRFNRDDTGGRPNQTDEERTFRKREEDTGGWRNKDRSDGGSWKDKENRGGGWKDNDSGGYKERSGGGGYKERSGGGGGWNEGGGDAANKFSRDGGGFKRGGYNQEDRSSFRQGSGDSFRKPAPKTPKPNTVGGMPHPVVKVGATEDTQVVYTTSPSEFYVQLTSSFDQLNELMERIATACETGSVENMSSVQDKAGCLAKYSEDDTWYRAVVEEKCFDSVKVLFVDYGNREAVALDKIKLLPEDMTTLPVQAVKCRLFGVQDSVEVDAFSALVDAKNLKTHFVSKHFSTNSFEVVLLDEESGSNINTVMGASAEEVQTVLSKLGTTSLSPQQCAPGTTLTTQMTWYISPSEFYLQVMNTHPEFRAMMQSMQTVAKSGVVKQNSDLNIGDFVIARFKQDKVLYRALVKDTGFDTQVQYVDYGNSEPVETGSVWAMQQEYATLPIQALNCSLAGVLHAGDSWPTGGTTPLDAHFESETLECCIVKEVDSQFLVQLTKGGQDVAQSIIEAGFALPSSDALGLVTELDPALLIAQLLPVTIVKVEDNLTFFAQPAAEDIELHSLETVAGEGIKCVLANVLSEETTELQQLSPPTKAIVQVDSVTPDGLTVTLFNEEGQIISGQSNDPSSVDKICPMPVFSTHMKAYVSHACPRGIYLHKAMFADLLADLIQRLYEFYNESEPVEHEWKIDDIICAQSVNDEQWYRARILKVDEEIEVQYIDYGNYETLPVSNLRKLDTSFYTPHALSLKVYLHVSWAVPEDKLLEVAEDTEYNAVVLRDNDGLWVVELLDGSGQSLTDKLVELEYATALENSPFKRVVEGGRFVEGSNINISVSFIDSPLQLWIFVGDDVEQINTLQDRLQEAAPKLPQHHDTTGIFAAKFSDDLWYRATLLENSTVRFIDYGNSDNVDLSNIKTLSADFLEPAEGFAVKVELPVGNFQTSATDRLNELLLSEEIDPEEEIIAQILSVKDSFIVADILKGGKSVVDILVEENLVTRVEKVCSGFVSHLNSLNNFFVQETSCIESLESIANSMLTADSFEHLAHVNEGDIVAALYTEDGLWYRAKVTKKSDDEIVVLFIDYGNSAVASDFRSLPSDIIEKPSLSRNCALQLPNGVSEWSASANEKFVELSADGCTQFDIKVLNKEDIATVLLSCNGKCVTEELSCYCEQQTVETLDTNSIDLTGYDTNVYICLINSPNDFYVQVEGAEVELEAIKEELSDTSAFEKLEQISNDLVGKLIGALFVDDELWYRAKVLNVTEEGSEVLFVDYGNTVTATNFVKLPEHLEIKEPVAIHCSFDDKSFSEESSNYFTEVSGDGTVPFLMKIVREGDPNIVSLILEDEDKVIENELSSRFGKSVSGIEKESITENYTEESENIASNDDSNIIKTVFLIQVNSPSDFFLQTSEATQQLEEISERLNAAADFPPIDEASLTKGNILAGQIDDDDLWYRAKIIDLSENEIKVLFIDYGNTATVAKVHSLPEDILSTPPLAMRCALSNIEGNEWTLEECETFNKLANDDSVSFDLKVLTEGELNVVELFANGKSVTEQLKAMNKSAAKENYDGENQFEDELLVNKEIVSEENLLDSTSLNSGDQEKEEFNEKMVTESSEEMEQIKDVEKLSSPVKESSEQIKDEEKLTSPVKESSEEAQKIKDEETLTSPVKESSEQIKDEEKLTSPVKESSEQIKDEEKLTSPVKESSEQIKDEETLTSPVKESSEQIKNEEKLTSPVIESSENTEQIKNKDLMSGDSLSETIVTQDNSEENNTEITNLILQSVDNTIQANLYSDMQEITDSLIMKATSLSYKTLSPIDPNLDINGKHESDENEDYESPDEERGSVSGKSGTSSEFVSPNNSENRLEVESRKSDLSFEENETKKDLSGNFVTPPSRSNIDDKLVPGCISSVQLDNSTKHS